MTKISFDLKVLETIFLAVSPTVQSYPLGPAGRTILPIVVYFGASGEHNEAVTAVAGGCMGRAMVRLLLT